MKLFTLVLAAISTSVFAEDELSQPKEFMGDCTGIVDMIAYEDGFSGPGYELGCETDNGDIHPVSVSQEFIKENFIDGEFVSGETSLTFPGGAMFDPKSLEIITSDDPRLRPVDVGNRAGNPVVGNRTVIVVRVIGADAETSHNESHLGDSVFGYGVDPANLSSQYAACSHGQLHFVPAEDRIGIDTNITNGVVTVTVNVTVNETKSVMVSAVSKELRYQFDVGKTKFLADHLMYSLPHGVFAGATASVNGWKSTYNDKAITYLTYQMHEIGHNIGQAHSGENGGEYNDKTGYMGFGTKQLNKPLKCFNAAKTWRFKWFPEKEIVVSDVGQRQYIGELAGFVEDPFDPSVPPMIVKLNTDTPDDFYVHFNRVTGFNKGSKEGKNKVHVVTTGKEGEKNSQSQLLAKLNPGESWVSNVTFGGETASVTVVSINERAYVSICVGECPTCVNAPLNITESGQGCADLDLDCSSEDIQSHCPVTCSACDEYECADSSVPWSLPDGNFSCAILASLDPETLDFYCDVVPGLEGTCRQTCNFCDPDSSPDQ